jgi:pyruvate,orthophosphate dikinase
MTSRQTEIFTIEPAAGVAAGPQEMGFKAYNLARMASVGLPVPQAFVLGTRFCRDYFKHGHKLPPDMRELLAAQIRRLELASGLTFGSDRRPLLVSVRSGAPISMPGMMDTVLDVGLTEMTLRGLLRMTGNPRLVWDSYRRLVQSFAEVAHHCEAAAFDAILDRHLQSAGVGRCQELDYRSLTQVAREYLALFETLTRRAFPQDPLEQLEEAVRAVFESWQSAKAKEYRRINKLDDDLGTAVTIQRMVFGNAGGTSGAGVAFTRDPASGENTLYMDFLFNAQGEDVVSGRRALEDSIRLRDILPGVFQQLQDARHALEAEFLDAQEIEFTVQDGAFFLLQTRTAKRTPWAALRIAVEQVHEGLIDPDAALERLKAYDLDEIQDVRLTTVDGARMLCRADSASIGVASGVIALDAAAANKAAAAGKDVILIREETSTDDIGGVAVARGILTALGGRTSHAAVVARQLNKVCLVGCRDLVIDLATRRCAISGEWLNEGDLICLDGHSGQVFAGAPQLVVEKPTAYLAEVVEWRNSSSTPKKSAGKKPASAGA